ncbi:hypothetical protein MOQ_001928 [Trypanosoma cruzi marinkellei]|uniref:Uncharacterized protein n=1 Tax=Trypanosoma cruzi marinkellei TaxID=85056 RepID=K2MRB7_TRYCR|nr:hypothetical protein MOQ_001928 [Trypanosoma cruzi marinkellei]
MDPTVPPLCDGVSFTLCDDDVYAFGGAVPEIIWRLHLVTHTWHEIPCNGSVPAARKHHAAVSFAGNLLLCGGEPLHASFLKPPKLMPYYELSLDNMTWRLIDTIGAIPLNRSHHACSVVGESMILLGGKPLLSKEDGVLTNERLDEFTQAGFYDVYIFDIISRFWRAVVALGPTPRLWGHSAAVYDERYILVFGGMDVSANEMVVISRYGSPHHRHDPPVAEVSAKLYILDTEQMKLRVVSPAVQYSTPPRAFHAAHIDGVRMYVLGGVTVAKQGNLVPFDDIRVYDIIEGKWSLMELPLQFPTAVRRLSFAYESQLVVVPSTTSMWCLDVHKQAVAKGWKEVPTSHVRVTTIPATSEADEYNELLNPRRCTSYDDIPCAHANRVELSHSMPPSTSPRAPSMQFDMIIDEIHQLRELLTQRGPRQPSPQSPRQQQEQNTEESPPTATVTEGPQPARNEVESSKMCERRRRGREKIKKLAHQKELILQLTRRLEHLLERRKREKQEETTESLAVGQQLPEKTSGEALEDDPLICSLAKHCECDASVPSPQSPLHDTLLSFQREGVEKKEQESFNNQDGTLDQWTTLIEILKKSPMKPSSKAFRASVIII